MAVTTISVSCTGDDAFRRRLKILAMRRNGRIAPLVRQAIEQVFGEELATITEGESAFLFGLDGLQKDHSNLEETNQ